MYHRIFEDERPVNIVFSGASQTGNAIQDKLISAELSKIKDRRIEAVNYGFCRRGRDIQYVMLKDLFSRKHPEILVVEVPEDEPKKSHPVFPYLAESGDLFSSFVFFNQRYFISIWKGIVVRFESLRSRIWHDQVSFPTDPHSEFAYRSSSQVVTDKVLEKNRKDWGKRLSKSKPPFLRKIELNYSKHYIEKIIALANTNNCRVIFLYLPESGSNLKQPMLLNYYQRYGDVIILPKDLIMDKSNWKDATHFNDSGASKASEHVVSYLTNYLH